MEVLGGPLQVNIGNYYSTFTEDIAQIRKNLNYIFDKLLENNIHLFY